MSANDTTTGVKRALTGPELDTILDAISAATTTAEVLHRAVVGVYTPLLADLGLSFDDFTPQCRLETTAYAIPTSQWQAIAAAVSQRAGEWGTAAHLALELVNYLPSHYDDPDTPAPVVARLDRRPSIHHLDVTRDATDVIAACDRHIQALADAYGRDSRIHLDALHSWHIHLSRLFNMGLGAHTSVRPDGPRSLIVTAGGGLLFGVIFHGDGRHCTTDGCHVRVNDDGTWHPYHTGAVILDHNHVPSYPLDAPQPGTWSIHS